MAVAEINVDELAPMLLAGVLLIDVREIGEYQSGHLPGALHVALGSVPDSIDSFRGDGSVYVVCRSGARSMRACEFLAEHDIPAINVAGGTLAWIQTGRSTVLGDSPS